MEGSAQGSLFSGVGFDAEFIQAAENHYPSHMGQQVKLGRRRFDKDTGHPRYWHSWLCYSEDREYPLRGPAVTCSP